jgi:effector-binding domain-containing protein
MADDVQVRQLPAQLALVVRTRASTETIKERMGDAYGALMGHAGATGAQFVGPPFTLYPELIEGEFAFAVCMPVAAGAVPGDKVGVEELPAVEAATLLHRGPYDSMEPSWRRLNDWVTANGRRPSDALREVYLNDPRQVEENELLTELVVPLA